MSHHKVRPFVCYFCNKTISDDSEMGHTSICGNVLIPCPNKCGSYIQRVQMYKHQNECVNRVEKSVPPTRQATVDNYGKNTMSLERNANKNLMEPLYKLQENFKKLSVKVANLSSENNGLLRQQLDYFKEVYGKQKLEIEKLMVQNQLLLEWKKAVELQFESLKQSLNHCQSFNKEIDTHWTTLRQKVMAIDQLQIDIVAYNETLAKDQNYNRQVNLEFAQNLDTLKDLYEQETSNLGALWNDHKTNIDSINKILGNLNGEIEEQKLKFISCLFDVKTVTQIASEASERIEIQEREFLELKRQVSQLKLDLEILEDLATSGSNFSLTTSATGHIMWRIGDFEEKMTLARERDNVLKSQIFYTHDFGYRVRVGIYLNGLKKWKNRYALISLHVLKGEFDGILKWPCHIEGTVILRDQTNLDNPTNFSKYITAKRKVGDEENEEPQESSSSYIFIPHTTLLTSKYLKDNTIYLEVRISQNRKLSAETNL